MEKLLLVQRKGNVHTLIMNRPEKGNSLSPDLLMNLCRTLEELSRTDDARVIVLRGAGEQAFSSGYDIGALPTSGIKNQEVARNPLQEAVNAIQDFPYPVIAMINGYAFGGACELAVCCDLRVAADDIVMGMTPAKLGMVYPPKGLLRFVQNLGFAATRNIFYTGRRFDARKIRELGLADYTVPRDRLESFTYELAEEIASNAPLSIKGTKRTLVMLLRSFQFADSDLREAQMIALEAFNSEDLIEGQRAFKEKRKPVWKGK